MQNVKQRQQEFNDDGTPRRKYEVDDAENGKWGLRSAIALALISGFALVKNVFYPAAMAGRDAEQPLSEGERHGDAVAHGLSAEPEGEIVPARERGPSEGASRPAASTVNAASNRASTIHTAEPPASDNDNVALYGAAPGKSIVLIPSHRGAGAYGEGDDIFAMPAGDGGHGGGGGHDDGGGPEDSGGDGETGGDRNDDENGDGDGGDDSDPGDPRNRAPVVSRPVQLGCLGVNQILVLTFADLLQNASDPDGDTLAISSLTASSGDIRFSTGGSWSFSPRQDDTSQVTFSYLVGDGELTVEQHAYLDLVPAIGGDETGPGKEVSGTDAADLLIGTPSADVIDARGGDDVVIGLDGGDVLLGGAGDDRIVAGAGNDAIHGGAGNDVVFAGSGDDAVFGGEGGDMLFGEDGDDAIFGENGDDTISGGAGDDVLDGGGGSDRLMGDEGRDVVDGGAGDDELSGGSGDDILRGGAGADGVAGGDGDDAFIAEAGDGDDTYSGGEGGDTLDLSATQAPALVDLASGEAESADIGSDMLGGIEHVRGGRGDDVIIASVEMNMLSGGEGADQFVFRTSASVGMGPLRDRLLDFEIGDRIDLDDISGEFAAAVEETLEDAEIRKFVLIGEQQAFQRPGQLKIIYDTAGEREVTVVVGNIDYDTDVEFELEIVGRHTLSDSDFHRAG